MKPDLNLLLAGFGGQGLLFGGKVVAYAGLIEGREISWLPAYGPEMRGGTANCSVCISDDPIGSPLVLSPNALIVMNLPSLDKFIDSVVPGGTVVVDSSMISKKIARTDVRAFYVPATKLCEDNDLKGLANIVLIGKLLRELSFSSEQSIDLALVKSVPVSKKALLDSNRKALLLGMGAE
jgi:2-oxoglutarate ferredoxin oxidoreductase subunit gamma